MLFTLNRNVHSSDHFKGVVQSQGDAFNKIQAKNIFPWSFDIFAARFEDSCLLKYDTVSLGRWCILFWQDHSFSDTVSYLRRLESPIFSLSLSRLWALPHWKSGLVVMKTVKQVSCYLWYQCIIQSYAHTVYLNTYTVCFTTLGHNCRRWFPRSLWSKKFI